MTQIDVAMSARARFEEASVRVERLIWLPAAISGEVMSSTLKDVLEDLGDGNQDQVLQKIPDLHEYFMSDEGDEDWAADILSKHDGFLAEMARPVPTSFYADASSHSYSWGYYQTKWVHVANMEELATVAEEFSEAVVARAYAKHLAKLAAATGIPA